MVHVVLFGSRARGSARADSDWDVAVFLTGTPQMEDCRALADVAYELILERGQFIQPVALAVARAGEDTLFLQRIRQDGVAL